MLKLKTFIPFFVTITIVIIFQFPVLKGNSITHDTIRSIRFVKGCDSNSIPVLECSLSQVFTNIPQAALLLNEDSHPQIMLDLNLSTFDYDRQGIVNTESEVNSIDNEVFGDPLNLSLHNDEPLNFASSKLFHNHSQKLQNIYHLYQNGKYQKIIDILSQKKGKLEPTEEYLLAIAYHNVGDINSAVEYWLKAYQSYLSARSLQGSDLKSEHSSSENEELATYCLLQLAQGYIELGRTSDAINAIQNYSYPLPNYALAILGNAYLAQGQIEQAIDYYQQSLTKELKTEALLAVLNNLGFSYEKLVVLMNQSAELAKKTEDTLEFENQARIATLNARKTKKQAYTLARSISSSNFGAITAKLNWLEYNPNDGQLIKQIEKDIKKLPPSHSQVQLSIQLAKFTTDSERYLQMALRSAGKTTNNLSLAIASAKLGNFYKKEHLLQKALIYTQKAIEYIYPLLIDDYLYQYQWQEARIYEGLNQTQNAILAYERSLNTLQKIRPQIAFSAKNIQFDFTESIEPIYRGLLKLLLTNNPNTSDLRESLNVFEEFQVVKLENLFADICVKREIDIVNQRLETERIVIITPIILDESIHVLVSTPDGKIYHHSDRISASVINSLLKQWRLDLSNINEQYLRQNKKGKLDLKARELL